MKVLSWNVNGVRAALGKGLLDWMASSRADVICLQEVKAMPGDVQGVAGGKSVAPTFQDGLATDYVTDAVLKSAKTGRWEKVRTV